MSIFAQLHPSAFHDMPTRECCAPMCHATPLPMLRIPLCRDCASDAAHQYYAERCAILSADPDQTAEEAANVAAGRIGAQGTVYFIRLGSRIKIGFTTNLQQRLENLPCEEILGTTPGIMADEKQCHKLFASDRIAGEWFEDTQRLRDFITAVTAAA